MVPAAITKYPHSSAVGLHLTSRFLYAFGSGWDSSVVGQGQTDIPTASEETMMHAYRQTASILDRALPGPKEREPTIGGGKVVDSLGPNPLQVGRTQNLASSLCHCRTIQRFTLLPGG